MKFDIDLEIVVTCKKRGYLGNYGKDKTFCRSLMVMADTEDEAADLAQERVLVQTPGYKLKGVTVTKCEESLKPETCTVTVTGKVWFKDPKKFQEEFRDVSLDYVYVNPISQMPQMTKMKKTERTEKTDSEGIEDSETAEPTTEYLESVDPEKETTECLIVDPEKTAEMLKNHAEARYRMEVQEMENFKYIEYIVCSIVSTEMERYIQI